MQNLSVVSLGPGPGDRFGVGFALQSGKPQVVQRNGTTYFFKDKNLVDSIIIRIFTAEYG